VGNLGINLVNLFELSFTMTELGNLDTNLGGYCEISFIMARVGNLDIRGYFELFFIIWQRWVIFYKI
jgi:hypothetical protein